MKNNKSLHMFLAFALMCGMLLPFAHVPASAAQTSIPSDIHGVNVISVEKKAAAHSKRLTSSGRNSTRVNSISIYPAAPTSSTSVGYYSGIGASMTYPVSNSTTAYTLTKDVKDDLFARFKKASNSDPTGWVVKITLLVETAKDYPADLYLKVNNKEVNPYPASVMDGYETITYYTTSDASSLYGYIQYDNGGGPADTEMISTGIIYQEG